MEMIERIYLQVFDDDGEPYDDNDDRRTWCEDKINDTDIEYTRAPVLGTTALEKGAWTTEPPKEVGWYWYKNDLLRKQIVVRIEHHERLGLSTVIFDGYIGLVLVKEMAGEDGAKFQGPIQPPEK